MKTRKLGQSGLEVSAIGFGCMGINFGYGKLGKIAYCRVCNLKSGGPFRQPADSISPPRRSTCSTFGDETAPLPTMRAGSSRDPPGGGLGRCHAARRVHDVGQLRPTVTLQLYGMNTDYTAHRNFTPRRST